MQAREDISRETVGGGEGRDTETETETGKETDGREGGTERDRREGGERGREGAVRGEGEKEGMQRQEDGWMVKRGRPGGGREERNGEGE